MSQTNAMDRKALLIELGTEELPPKALDELAGAFRDGVVAGLQKRGIAFDAASARALFSPRRLAVRIDGVATAQPAQAQERRGPAVAAGFDASGAPTKALSGFAASCGVDVAALEKLETDKGAWFVHRSVKPGEATAALLPTIAGEALAALPVPKPMRWGDRDTLFVRPVHWLVMLLGDAIVEGEVLGLKSDRFSRGHRFHHPKPVWIGSPADYVDALRAAHVLVDPDERRAKVADLVARAAQPNGKADLPPALLDEVKNLVEWPVAIACTFEREFLRVPSEALVTTMESNQKFFPVRDAHGALTEHFVGVANVASKDPAEIRKGYERVIRPRFADAAFFFDSDMKTPLASQQDALAKVTYQQKLGSVWDKCVRVAELSRTIANRLGVDAAAATRAAALCKCDLMTRMVGEFPELQGTMGRYYATAQGEPAEIARALDEFYAPRFAGDEIAAGAVARVLAVAEKIDTLAGLFAIGQKPSGNKDPFSLRRTALGLARTLVEAQLDLDLPALIDEAVQRVPNRATGASLTIPEWNRQVDPAVADVYDFVLERLRSYYADLGVRSDVFDAVAALRPVSLLDFDRRLRAVVEFARRPEAEALAAANKRIANILRQAQEKGMAPTGSIDSAAIEGGAEANLEHAIANAIEALEPLLAQHRYVDALARLATLREPVDGFFDGVMVMVEGPAQRNNRLLMLDRLRRLFLRIADVSVLGAK